ncbi:hypothetical protein [Sulfurimonas sp. HSL3-7]|uniref:hypothetical protein n=1 Tax=Sulfonitrofixus jiaomeiensis TaxID=3131938 RepID=UPI0031F8897B
MGACGYVPPDVRLKQEIIELVIELEAMGEEAEFCRLVLEEDILNFYKLQNSAKDIDASSK